jgi:hypothetical protein
MATRFEVVVYQVTSEEEDDWLKNIPDPQNPGKTFRESGIEILESLLAEAEGDVGRPVVGEGAE